MAPAGVASVADASVRPAGAWAHTLAARFTEPPWIPVRDRITAPTWRPTWSWSPFAVACCARGRAADGLLGLPEEREDPVAGADAVLGLPAALGDRGARLLVEGFGAGEVGLVPELLGEPGGVDHVGEEQHHRVVLRTWVGRRRRVRAGRLLRCLREQLPRCAFGHGHPELREARGGRGGGGLRRLGGLRPEHPGQAELGPPELGEAADPGGGLDGVAVAGRGVVDAPGRGGEIGLHTGQQHHEPLGQEHAVVGSVVERRTPAGERLRRRDRIGHLDERGNPLDATDEHRVRPVDEIGAAAKRSPHPVDLVAVERHEELDQVDRVSIRGVVRQLTVDDHWSIADRVLITSPWDKRAVTSAGKTRDALHV